MSLIEPERSEEQSPLMMDEGSFQSKDIEAGNSERMLGGMLDSSALDGPVGWGLICVVAYSFAASCAVGGVLIWQYTKLESANCHESLADIILAYGVFSISVGFFASGAMFSLLMGTNGIVNLCFGLMTLWSGLGNFGCLIGSTAMAWGGQADGCPDKEINDIRTILICLWCMAGISCCLQMGSRGEN